MCSMEVRVKDQIADIFALQYKPIGATTVAFAVESRRFANTILSMLISPTQAFSTFSAQSIFELDITCQKRANMLPRAELLLPSLCLAGCVSVAIFQDTTGASLSDNERLNYFPATPLFGVTRVFDGRLYVADDLTDIATLRGSAPSPRLWVPPLSLVRVVVGAKEISAHSPWAFILTHGEHCAQTRTNAKFRQQLLRPLCRTAQILKRSGLSFAPL